MKISDREFIPYQLKIQSTFVFICMCKSKHQNRALVEYHSFLLYYMLKEMNRL